MKYQLIEEPTLKKGPDTIYLTQKETYGLRKKAIEYQYNPETNELRDEDNNIIDYIIHKA